MYQEHNNEVQKIKDTIDNLWELGIKAVFGDNIPDSAMWTTPYDIYSVLSQVTSSKIPANGNIGARTSNHTFYPNGGGNDLHACRMSSDTLIDLFFSQDLNIADRVKPAKLYFEKIGSTLELAYFRLEIDSLQPIENAENWFADELTISHQAITETESITYNDKYGLKRDRTIYITRRLLPGAYVTFKSSSIYNMATGSFDAYDGRHNKMTTEKFKIYISKLNSEIERLKKEKVS